MNHRTTSGVADAADTAALHRFLIGDWVVDPAANRLERGDERVDLEPRCMAVLRELSRRSGEVVSAQELLDSCWRGEALSDSPVHRTVSLLRRALQDSAVTPRYLETVRKRGYRLRATVHVLSAFGPRGHLRSWNGRSPFRGLEAFGIDNASVFFGRDGAIASLHALLDAQWRRGHPLVVLLGASGSGKTSLVQAGLLPALFGSAGTAPALRALAVADADLGEAPDGPWSALAGALLDWEHEGQPLLGGYSIDSLAARLHDAPTVLLRDLALRLDTLVDRARDCVPLLVLDRFEALLLRGADAERFVATLGVLVRSRLFVTLVVCRNDFYAALAQHPLLLQDKEIGAHMDLLPPDAVALGEMIRLPARAAGLVYGTNPDGLLRLDDRLCADAHLAVDALPLLQYTLQALYEGRGTGGELTWSAYTALGGLEGAIGHRAEVVFALQPTSSQEAWNLLLPRLVNLAAEDAPPTGRWARFEELSDGHERELASALVEARLLVSDRRGAIAGLRLAHEALLRRWPRVSSWIAQHRAALATRGELLPWMSRWIDGERGHALLLPRGALLWKAGERVAAGDPVFGADEREFVQRSLERIRRQGHYRWMAAAGAVALTVAACLSAARSAWLERIASERQLKTTRLASFMLGDLADRLRPIGKLDLLASLGEQGLQALGGDDGAGESAHAALQRAKALVTIGEVNSSRGRSRDDIAVPALREARRILRALDGNPELTPADYYKTIGAAAFWLGQIAFDEDVLDVASDEMERYRDACERWRAATPNDAQARSELAYALSSLGSVATRRARWREARHQFESALALKAAMLAEHPGNDAAIAAVASAQTWLGEAAYVLGEPSAALRLYDAAMAAQADLLARQPDEQLRQHDLAVLQVRRSEALGALGRPADALAAVEDAVARLARASARDQANVRWETELLHMRSWLMLTRLEVSGTAAPEMAALEAALEARRGAGRPVDGLWRVVAMRLDAAAAAIALRAGDLAGASAAAERTEAALLAQPASHPPSWQLRELQARVGRIRIDAADAHSRPRACARTRDALRPAVDAGQAGIVLQTWRAASDCADATTAAGQKNPNTRGATS